MKDKKFTKHDIINRIKSINGYEKYMPDHVNLIPLSRDYLITVSNHFKNFITIFITIDTSGDQPWKIRSNV